MANKHPIYKLIEGDESGVLFDGARAYTVGGKECLSIVATEISLLTNLVAAALYLGENMSQDEKDAVSGALSTARFDTWALENIIYFPQVPWRDSSEMGEEDQDHVEGE